MRFTVTVHADVEVVATGRMELLIEELEEAYSDNDEDTIDEINEKLKELVEEYLEEDFSDVEVMDIILD